MKKEVKPIPFLYPIPIVLLGVKTEQRVNFTTIGDVAVMGLNPPLIVVSLHENHFSTKWVRTIKQFSINLPVQEMLSRVDFCGMVSGKDEDKSNIFQWNTTPLYPNVPLIEESPANLICTVLQEVQVEKRCIFICNIVQTWLEEDLIDKSLNQWSPIAYGLDNRYYTMGEVIGTGYKEGQKWKLKA